MVIQILSFLAGSARWLTVTSATQMSGLRVSSGSLTSLGGGGKSFACAVGDCLFQCVNCYCKPEHVGRAQGDLHAVTARAWMRFVSRCESPSDGEKGAEGLL